MSQANFEILLVDNGSTDNTKEICALYKNRFNSIKYIFEKKPGLHVCRHVGMKRASGRILAYIDDDSEVFPSWLDGISDAFKDHNVALVGGKNLPKFDSPPPLWVETLWMSNIWGKYLGYYSLLDFGDKPFEIDPDYIWGCNFSVRKDMLLAAGGFHPDAMPRGLVRYRGDGESAVHEAVKKNGWKAIYNPEASVHHLVTSQRMTKEYIYDRAFLQGISDSYKKVRTFGMVEDKGAARKRRGVMRALLERLAGKDVRRNQETIMHELRKNDVQRALDVGYQNGYAFHQGEVERDPQLYKWVTKENYLEADECL
jgi:glycosyltransferase involved in cell wall biosynthesis